MEINFLIFHYIPTKSSKRTKHDGSFQKATYLCLCFTQHGVPLTKLGKLNLGVIVNIYFSELPLAKMFSVMIAELSLDNFLNNSLGLNSPLNELYKQDSC